MTTGEDSQRALEIRGRLKKSFAFLAPEKQTFTLKDGGSGEQLVADPDKIKVSEANGITHLSGGEKDLYFSIRKDVLLVVTSADLLSETDGNFYQSSDYTSLVRDVLYGVDSVFFGRADVLSLPGFEHIAISEKNSGSMSEWYGILR